MNFGINGAFTDRSTITAADFGRTIEERGFDSLVCADGSRRPATLAT